MSRLMDLVAGDAREILLAIAAEDWASFDDRARFDAHLDLGGGLDPTWLDQFSEAVRSVTGREAPSSFLDALRELEESDGPGPGAPNTSGMADVAGERTVERVDPAWLGAIAVLPDHDIDAVAGRWIDLVEEELGELPREEKPWIRQLAGQIVAFARAAGRSRDVLFAWSL